MKRVLATAILACLALVATATIASAAGNANAKIMLHGLTTTTKNPCTRVSLTTGTNVPATCSGYDAGINNLPLYPALRYVYLLGVNGSTTEGIAGVECGIATTPDFAVYGWSLCATLEFQTPGIPWGNNGSGNLITWDSVNKCQTAGPAGIGAVAVAGYFYCAAYAPVCVTVTPRPVSGLAKVANCASIEDITYVGDDAHTFLGRACFGAGNIGINPCGRELPVPVQNTSWSGVKTIFE